MLMIVLSFMIGSVGFSQQQLTGIVTYGGNEELPMSDVTVGIYNLQDSLILSTNTDTSGIYYFDSIPSGEYILKSTTTEEPAGVNIDDAYILLLTANKHYRWYLQSGSRNSGYTIKRRGSGLSTGSAPVSQ